MKNAQWYYNEMDKLEKQLKECKDQNKRNQLESRLDLLHDELYELRH